MNSRHNTDNNAPLLSIFAALVFGLLTPWSGAVAQNSTDHRDVMALIGELRAQATRDARELSELREQVRMLEANSIPCTLDRFINDECGDYNQPFNLSMALCGSTSGGAGIGADFQINNHNSLELGAGWDEVIDANIKRSITFPGIPGVGWATLATTRSPAGFVYGSPFPDLSGGVGAETSLALSGCIEVPIPIRDVPRDQVVALLGQWQAQGRNLQNEILASASRMDIVPNRVTSSLGALEVAQSKSLSDLADAALNDPFQIFSRGSSLGNLVDVLPIGDRVEEVLDSADVLIEPFSNDIPRRDLVNVGATCNLFAGAAAPDLLRVPMRTICRPLTAPPSFDDVIRLIERIDFLPNENRLKDIVCDHTRLSTNILLCNRS